MGDAVRESSFNVRDETDLTHVLRDSCRNRFEMLRSLRSPSVLRTLLLVCVVSSDATDAPNEESGDIRSHADVISAALPADHAMFHSVRLLNVFFSFAHPDTIESMHVFFFFSL